MYRRHLISLLPRGRARLARLATLGRTRPFVDLVEPSSVGARLVIDPRDPFQRAMWVGAYQPHVVQWVQDNVMPGFTVLCLGLHVGYIAALCRRLALQRGRGRVFSAEPDPKALAIAERNLALADEWNAPITIFPGALGAESGTRALYESRVVGHSSFAAPHQPLGRRDVPETTGDAFLAVHGVTALDVLVLDVEGWELNVLRGLEQTIARSPTLRVCIELSPWALADAGATAYDVIAWLQQRGVALEHLHADDWATTHGWLTQMSAHASTSP